MKRYIDAEKVICDLENAIIDNSIHPETFTFLAVKEFIKLLKSTPTADVEEVVRCKNCARVNKYKDRYFCRIDNSEMKADDYCSSGERSGTK